MKEHRRQGVGAALLEKMLRDVRKEGARAAVLLASHTGALLYPQLGFQRIGQLYIYAPPKPK
jgi:predicted N-acetyltransferase YhbS